MNHVKDNNLDDLLVPDFFFTLIAPSLAGLRFSGNNNLDARINILVRSIRYTFGSMTGDDGYSLSQRVYWFSSSPQIASPVNTHKYTSTLVD
jgi:hypothetical protein